MTLHPVLVKYDHDTFSAMTPRIPESVGDRILLREIRDGKAVFVPHTVTGVDQYGSLDRWHVQKID